MLKTSPELEEAYRKYAANHTRTQFCKYFEKSYATTCKIYERLGFCKYQKPILYDIEKIKEFAKSHTIKEIADNFSMSEYYARDFIRRYKIDCLKKREVIRIPGVDTSDLSELKDYFKTHYVADISNHYGISATKVWNIAKKLNIKPLSAKKKSNVDRDEIIKFLSQTYTYSTIAAAFNMTRQRVEQIINN